MINTSLTPRRAKKRKKSNSNLLLVLFAAFLIIGAQLGWLWARYSTYKPWTFEEGITIFLQGSPLKGKAVYENDTLYLPYELIRDNIDPGIRWDKANNILIITSKNDVYQLAANKPLVLHNMKEEGLLNPLLAKSGRMYLPLDFLKRVYPLEIIEKKDRGLAIIHKIQKPYQNGIVQSESKLRHSRSLLSPWTAEVKKDQNVRIYKDEGAWFWIETTSGDMGYIRKDKIELAGIECIAEQDNNVLQSRIIMYFSPLTPLVFRFFTPGNMQA